MVSTTSASKKQFNIQVQRAYAGLDDILHICPIYKFIVFHLRNRKLGIFGQTPELAKKFCENYKNSRASHNTAAGSSIPRTLYRIESVFPLQRMEFWPLSSFLLFPLFFLFLCSVHTVGTWLFSLFQLLQLHRQCLCLLASPSRQRRRHQQTQSCKMYADHWRPWNNIYKAGAKKTKIQPLNTRTATGISKGRSTAHNWKNGTMQ